MQSHWPTTPSSTPVPELLIASMRGCNSPQRTTAVAGDYVFPGRFGGHETIQIDRALEAALRRAALTDVSSHNLRKTFATRLLSRGAAITDVQHLLGHASVKTTENAYAAFVKNERFKQTIDLLDKPVVPKLKVVR